MFGFTIIRTSKYRLLCSIRDAYFHDTRVKSLTKECNTMDEWNKELQRMLRFACQKYPDLEKSFSPEKEKQLKQALYGTI